MNPAILLKHYDELKGNLAISFNSTAARLIVLGSVFLCKVSLQGSFEK